MTVIAMEGAATPLGAGLLSRRTRIPVHYLSKVLRRLVTKKLLQARRGVGGGFVLARPAGKIRFIEILRAVGFELDETHCVFGWRRCNSQQPCPLHPSWKRVKRAFQTWTEQTTLAGVRS